MTGVTGIGGFLFRAKDPAALNARYREMLGIAAGHDQVWRQAAGKTAFVPFREASDYFAADRRWMLNLRVDGLDALITGLRDAGIEVKTDPSWDDTGYGRFARIHDPEGNPIELWEPAVTPLPETA